MTTIPSNLPSDKPDNWLASKRIPREQRPCSKCGERSRWKKYSWCRVCINERTRRNYEPERQRGYNLRAHFDISQVDYDVMLLQQGGACALCGKVITKINPQTGRVWPLCTDHNHSTGHVRELLCHGCTFLVGVVEKD